MTAENHKHQITVYGTNWCGDCRRTRNLLKEHKINYHWIDIDKDPEGEAFVINTNKGMRIVPTIIFPDKTILVEPSDVELLQKLNLY